MLLVALALVWTSSSCGKLPLDTDPLESMAEVVSEDKRFPAPLSESWRRVPNHPITFRPAVGTKSVYLVANKRLVAWSVGTGETLWDPVDLESEVTAAPVAIGQQVVIATGGSESTDPRIWWFLNDGSLHSQKPVETPISEINAVPGTTIYIDERGVGRLDDVREWHTPLDKPTTIDLAAEHRLALITTGGGSLFAFQVSDGNIRWQYDAGVGITRAAVADDRAYIGTADGDVIAFNIENGRVDWRRMLGTSVVGSPAQVEDFLWVAGLDARLTAIKASNGTHMHSVNLSSRNYLDVTPFGRWVVVGAHYGPWLAVRASSRVEQDQGLTAPVQVSIPGPPVTNQKALIIPAGTGPAGVAIVNGDGTIVFLEPQRAQ